MNHRKTVTTLQEVYNFVYSRQCYTSKDFMRHFRVVQGSTTRWNTRLQKLGLISKGYIGGRQFKYECTNDPCAERAAGVKRPTKQETKALDIYRWIGKTKGVSRDEIQTHFVLDQDLLAKHLHWLTQNKLITRSGYSGPHALFKAYDVAD